MYPNLEFHGDNLKRHGRGLEQLKVKAYNLQKSPVDFKLAREP